MILVVGACSSETDEAASPPAAPVAVPDTPPTLAVELGTGPAAFQPLAENGEVRVIYGPQGGYHIWTAVRVRDPSVSRAVVNLSVFNEDRSLAGLRSSEAVQLSITPEDTREVAGLRSFVFTKRPAETRLIVRIEVIAPDKRHGASERRVVVAP